MKKTTGTLICFLAIMGFFFIIAGCKKEQKQEWPEGLEGRFVISDFDDMGKSVVYSMDKNGVKRLLTMYDNCNGCGIGWIKWAPDGSYFLYENGYYSSVRQAFFIALADGTGQTKICDALGQENYGLLKNVRPVWSPDSKKIAFVTMDPGIPDLKIKSMNADGTGVQVLATGHSPEWSPDGTMIAFVNSDSVCTVNADGTGFRVLAKGNNPYWSPDGSHILFYNDNAVWRVSLSGNLLRKLASLPDGIVPKYWSPGRDRVICLSGFYGDFFIFTLSDSTLVRVSDNFAPGDGVRSYHFCWSKDGTRIAYSKENTHQEQDGLHVMNADGSNSTGVGLKWLGFAPKGLDWW